LAFRPGKQANAQPISPPQLSNECGVNKAEDKYAFGG
jgi:hypothetical protein